MKPGKPQSTFVNIGSSSLLIVFLVLCLTSFAILSLSSAQNDYTFSKRLAGHKTEYYEASSRAELILGEIDKILEENAGEPAAAAAALNGREIDHIALSCTGDGTEADTMISYQVPSGEKQALQVSLLVTDGPEQETYYQIRTWRLISTADWQADDSLKLIPVE